MESLVKELTNKCQSNTLFGKQVLQSYAGIVLYEKLLTEYENRIHWICEIGTATGMLALYFAVWARLRYIPFITIDNGAADWAWPMRAETRSCLKDLNARVIRGNCFQTPHYADICTQLRKSSGFLLCDGGNKPKELKKFGPHAGKGSIIVCHDWPIEFKAADVEAVPEVTYLEPWHTMSLEGGTKAAVLERI